MNTDSNKKNYVIPDDEQLLRSYLTYKGVNTSGNTQLDKEKEIESNKLNTLEANNALKQTYENQVNSLNQAKMQAEQAATISNERLMKYLGQQQQLSGLASGQRGTDYINATNNYMQNRANIAQNYASQQANALENYKQNVIKNDETARQNEINILDKYRTLDLQQKELDDAEDSDTAVKVNNWIQNMITEYADEDGKITKDEDEAIKNKINAYKTQFKREENYNDVLDYYNNLMYGKVLDKTNDDIKAEEAEKEANKKKIYAFKSLKKYK